MAASTGQPARPAAERWALLLRPRWLVWHAFAVLSAAGMLLLGDWQLHRAESGNELSWAYTFEWPLFAAFTGYFWIKSLRDEVRQHATDARTDPRPEAAEAGNAASAADTSAAAASGPGAPGLSTAPDVVSMSGAPTSEGVGVAVTPPVASRRADSWDSTSWDAASWDATRQQADADGTAQPVDTARATPADGEAYVARLLAEVQRSGRRRAGR